MKAPSLKKFNWPTLLRALGSLAATGLLLYLVSQQGWPEIKALMKQIPPWNLAAAAGLMVVSRLAVACRWYALLHSAKAGISFRESLRITFAGLFAANFLPTTVGGDVVRLAGAIQARQDAALSAASLIADRLIGMAGMAMMLPLGLPRFLNSPGPASSALSRLIVTAGSFLFGLPRAEWNRSGSEAASVFLLGWAQMLFKKGFNLVRKMNTAVALWLRQPQALLFALVFTWIHMLCTFGVLAFLFAGMGQEISFGTIAGLYSLVYFVTLAPISINGYGLQELSLTYIFARLGGVSADSAFSAALLYRTLMMLVSLPGAFFIPGFLPGANRHPRTANR